VALVAPGVALTFQHPYPNTHGVFLGCSLQARLFADFYPTADLIGVSVILYTQTSYYPGGLPC
jgi:hypothetical protein